MTGLVFVDSIGEMCNTGYTTVSYVGKNFLDREYLTGIGLIS